MIIFNDSTQLSPTTTTTTSNQTYLNSTIELTDSSSVSIILTIIILSCLSISGWIFMSYALFGRSEAYRSKPGDQNMNSDRDAGHDLFSAFE